MKKLDGIWRSEQMVSYFSSLIRTLTLFFSTVGCTFWSRIMDAEAVIKVSRSHSRFTHDIRIDIRGNIEKEYLRRIFNYLEENLKIEKLFEKDIFLFN